MAGLVAAIHVFARVRALKAWMPGTRLGHGVAWLHWYLTERLANLRSDLLQHLATLRQHAAECMEVVRHAGVAGVIDAGHRLRRAQRHRRRLHRAADRTRRCGRSPAVVHGDRRHEAARRVDRRDRCRRQIVRQIGRQCRLDRSGSRARIPGAMLTARRSRAPDKSGIAARRERLLSRSVWQATAASVAPAESPQTASFAGSMPNVAACRAVSRTAVIASSMAAGKRCSGARR